jgi:pimeloyl-ACP methyl ester carboxylesterase
MIKRIVHTGMDVVMCTMMNAAQWRLRHHAVTSERLNDYLSHCEPLDHRGYYGLPEELKKRPATVWKRDGNILSWTSPLQGEHVENNTARARLHEPEKPEKAPTLILLHALMSANDLGYRKIAARYNKRGWNVLFPHLPYHYSRTPKKHSNGSLAITSDLIRNAETLRQSVIELRQLIRWSKRRGSGRVALLATSYGAWVAALTLSLEETDFSILLQPVADVTHSTFGSPASRMMAALLKKNGVTSSALDRHAHLTAPGRLTPLTSPERILVIGGRHDRLSPPDSLKTLCSSWGGARYREVNQGHFGYAAMRCALAEADRYI